MTNEQQEGPATPAGPSAPDLPAHGRPPATPELNKQAEAIKDGAHRIGEFLDWMEAKGIRLARYNEDAHQLWGAHESYQELIAGFYGIDLEKIEQERRALLEYLRVTR